ncbi:MAG: hypothetical protein Q8Q15_04505 [bacterium]|nr:hypothetical protein [bacterium]
MNVERGSFRQTSERKHWITPVAGFVAEHPKKAKLVVSAVVGGAIGLVVGPRVLPALTNAVEKLSLALQP